MLIIFIMCLGMGFFPGGRMMMLMTSENGGQNLKFSPRIQYLLLVVKLVENHGTQKLVLGADLRCCIVISINQFILVRSYFGSGFELLTMMMTTILPNDFLKLTTKEQPDLGIYNYSQGYIGWLFRHR